LRLLSYTEEEFYYIVCFDRHPDDKAIREAKQVERNSSFRFSSISTKSVEVVWLSWHCNADLGERLIFATAIVFLKKETAKLRQTNNL
jgi:hypothetical protein